MCYHQNPCADKQKPNYKRPVTWHAPTTKIPRSRGDACIQQLQDETTLRETCPRNVLQYLRFHVTPRPPAFARWIGRIRAARVRFAILNEGRRTQATVNCSSVLLSITRRRLFQIAFKSRAENAIENKPELRQRLQLLTRIPLFLLRRCARDQSKAQEKRNLQHVAKSF